jgi:hypothetical protein
MTSIEVKCGTESKTLHNVLKSWSFRDFQQQVESALQLIEGCKIPQWPSTQKEKTLGEVMQKWRQPYKVMVIGTKKSTQSSFMDVETDQTSHKALYNQAMADA